MSSKPPSVTTAPDAAIFARELVANEKALLAYLEEQGVALSPADARRALQDHLDEGAGAIKDKAIPRRRRGYGALEVRAVLRTLYGDLLRDAPPSAGPAGRPNDAVATWEAKGDGLRMRVLDARLEAVLEILASLPGQSKRTPPSSPAVAKAMRARGHKITPAQARAARDLFLRMATADRCTFSRIQYFERKVASARFVTTWEVDPATGKRVSLLETRLEVRRRYRRRGDISPEAENAINPRRRPGPCTQRLIDLAAKADMAGEDGTALLERFLDWKGPRCEYCDSPIPGARPGQKFGSPACRQAAHAATRPAKN